MIKDDHVLNKMKELKKNIRRIVKKWYEPLGLEWWTVDINYIYESPTSSAHPGAGVGASSRPQWEYKQASINFYLPELLGMNLESLENLIVHELVHTHLSIMQADMKPSQHDDYQKLVELTTTLITEALLWVRDFAIKGKIPPEA